MSAKPADVKKLFISSMVNFGAGFSLCALSTRRIIGGSIFIGDAYKICELLLELKNEGLIDLKIDLRKTIRGLFSESVANWLSLSGIHEAVEPGAIDSYGFLEISTNFNRDICDSIADALRFFSDDDLKSFKHLAEQLKIAHVVNDIDNHISYLIGRILRHVKDGELLKVLIPEICISAFDDLGFEPGIESEIKRHWQHCRFCRPVIDISCPRLPL